MTRSSSNGEGAVNRAYNGGGLAHFSRRTAWATAPGSRAGETGPLSCFSSTGRDEPFGNRVRS